MLDQTDAPTSPTTAVDGRLATLFPGDAPPARPWWRRHLAALVVIVVAIALVVSVLTATGALGSTGPSYRTATVGTHAVAATITSVATVEPVSQATVAFPITGTVATVGVTLGASVGVGQQLATLDTSDLTVTLHEKEQTLANAQLTLSRALNGESVGPSSSGSNASGSSRTGNVAAASSSGPNPVQLTAIQTGPGGQAGGDVAAAQHAVLQAQQQVDAALRKAQADLATATTVCTAAGVTPPAGGSGGGGSGGSSGGSGGSGGTGDLAACQAAVATVLADQQAVSDAQHALSDASDHLDGLLDQRAAETNGATGASGGSGGSARTGGNGGSGSSGQSSPSSSSSPSAAQLVAYQQAVDAAAAQVAVAQQALDQATVISPIAGTVVAVNLAPGQDVTAGSSTANIVVQGAGGYEASTNLTIDEVRDVKLGQRAVITPDGTDRPLGGQVISIAALPDSTSTATPTYRVFVALDQPDSPLHNGGTASLAIVTGRTTSALAVPTSAVTTTGTRHTVQVVDGDQTKTVTVKVGVVGDTWTQVTDGVHAGQQVVLADVSRPLPDSATSSSNGQTNGFPAGGAFPRFTFGGGGGGAGGAGLFTRNR